MSQIIPPYWIGNVTHILRLRKRHDTGSGPDDTENQYPSTPVQQPLAKVMPLTTAQKKKDVPQP